MTTPPKGKVSLQDVAKEAGVSVSTVSRALAFPDRISQKTREKVLKVAQDLGYHPNIAARNLRLGHSRTILAVMPHHKGSVISTVAGEAISGIQKYIRAKGYALSVVTTDFTPATSNHALDLAFGRQVSGVIFFAAHPPEEAGRNMIDAGLPMVSLTEDLAHLGIRSVVSSDRQSMIDAVGRLAGLGHERFAFVSGPPDSYHSTQREAGVRSGLLQRFGTDAGLAKISADFSVDTGVAAAQRYLKMAERPTAVISWADEVALGFQSTVLAAGLSIPRDLSLISFDGLHALRFLHPAISTYDQSPGRLGSYAARLLLEEIETGTPPASRLIEIPATLREGGSLGPPPR